MHLLESKKNRKNKRIKIHLMTGYGSDKSDQKMVLCTADKKTANDLARVLRQSARHILVPPMHSYMMMESYAQIKEGEDVYLDLKCVTKNVIEWFNVNSDLLQDKIVASNKISWF